MKVQWRKYLKISSILIAFTASFAAFQNFTSYSSLMENVSGSLSTHPIKKKSPHENKNSDDEIETPLKFVFCDVKRSVAQRAEGFTRENYKQYINAFKTKLKCNGIRVHIDSKTPAHKVDEVARDKNQESYTELYRDVFSYARSQGLYIYANLIPELGRANEFDFDPQKWIKAVSAYANHFCPDFVGPFNEMRRFDFPAEVAAGVKASLKPNCKDPDGHVIKRMKLVGPDTGAVSAALSYFKEHPGMLEHFDIVGAHNNNAGANYAAGGDDARDRSAIASDWKTLRKQAGMRTWASEASATWSAIPFAGIHKGKEVGVKAIMASKAIEAIVLYDAANRINDKTFELTKRGELLRSGMKANGWK